MIDPNKENASILLQSVCHLEARIKKLEDRLDAIEDTMNVLGEVTGTHETWLEELQEVADNKWA